MSIVFPSIQLTSKDKLQASKMAQIRLNAVKKYGKRNRFGTDRENYVGCVGEVLFARYFGLDPDFNEYAGADNYDFLLDGSSIDVKTSTANYDPYSDWFVKIAERHYSKDVDVLVFVSMNKLSSDCFFLGCIELDEFKRKCKFVAKGTVKPNGFVCRNNQYELPVSELYPIESLRSILRRRQDEAKAH